MEFKCELKTDEQRVGAIAKWFPMILKIQNHELALKTANVWIRVLEMCKWETPEQIPWGVKYPSRRLMDHINVVTEGSFILAKLMNDQQGFGMDLDKIIVVGLLHDVSKTIEFEPDDKDGVRYSEIGLNVQHAVMGGTYALDAGISMDIVNMIMSHTPQSNTKSKYPEGFIVTFVDSADADTIYWLHGDPMETYLKI